LITELLIDFLQEFSDCQCIADGHATAGLCPQFCWSFYVFVVVVFGTFLLNSMMIVPFITVMLRYYQIKSNQIIYLVKQIQRQIWQNE